jgi:hypothetical protein
MSIDEYLKQEYEMGNFLSGGTNPKKSDLADGYFFGCSIFNDNLTFPISCMPCDSEDEEIDENAIYKKREWDTFKDGMRFLSECVAF